MAREDSYFPCLHPILSGGCRANSSGNKCHCPSGDDEAWSRGGGSTRKSEDRWGCGKAEQLPGHHGMVVEAKVDPHSGRGVLVEPSGDQGVDPGVRVEDMLVEPNEEGKVRFVVVNESSEPVKLPLDHLIGQGHWVVGSVSEEEFCEVVAEEEEYPEQGLQGVVECVGQVQHVEVDEVSLSARQRTLKGMVQVGGAREASEECEQLRSLVMESHDVFAVEDGERGEVKEVLHGGDSPPYQAGTKASSFCSEV